MPNIRIIIASDEAVIRAALAALLDGVDGFEVAAAVRLATLRGLPSKSADVLLLEVPESHVGSLGSIGSGRHSARVRGVVLLDSNPNPAYIRSLFTLGAKAYVLKSSNTRDLYKAIRLAERGHRYLDPQLAIPIANNLLHAHGAPAANGVAHLSRREAQVIREVARGFTSKAIARKLGVSQKTIQTYRSRIYEKLQLRTRAELVQYAIGNGLMLGTSGSEELAAESGSNCYSKCF